MTGYIKLFGSILASTVWREDNETRIVWITLLAMADRDGLAEGSVPGLADFARLPVDDVRRALDKLSSPDPDSRTPDHEGRRIQKVDGGWLVLNHAKYRAKMNLDDRREYLRKKQAEHRQRKRGQEFGDGQQPSTNDAARTGRRHNTEADTEPEPEAKAKAHSPTCSSGGDSDGFCERFDTLWQSYPKKDAKAAGMSAYRKLNPDAELQAVILNAVQSQSGSDAWCREGGRFVPHLSKWLLGRRWEDSIEPGLSTTNNDRGRPDPLAALVDIVAIPAAHQASFLKGVSSRPRGDGTVELLVPDSATRERIERMFMEMWNEDGVRVIIADGSPVL